MTYLSNEVAKGHVIGDSIELRAVLVAIEKVHSLHTTYPSGCHDGGVAAFLLQDSFEHL